MRLEFKDEQLKALCECQQQLYDVFGPTVAEHVQDTLWILFYAPTLADVSVRPPFSLQSHEGHPESFFSIGTFSLGQLHIEALEWNGSLATVNAVKIVHIQGPD